jgi:hypothetical protein
LHEHVSAFLIISRWVLLRMRNVLDKSCIASEIQYMCFRKSSCLCDYVKNVKSEQATGDIMSRAHCMLDNYGYRHIFKLPNTYCFSTATVVTRTRLNITLYVLLFHIEYLNGAYYYHNKWLLFSCT